LASFEVDQAEGLRRMVDGPKPRIFTFLSAAPDDEKEAMLVNLGASLADAGSRVLLLDACPDLRGISARLGASDGATLLQVARQERALNEAIELMPQGFGIATLTHGALEPALRDADQARRLANTFDVLATQTDIMLVDAELGAEDDLPLPAMAAAQIVVQVSADAASIKSAYAIIKRLHARLGRRPYSVLVTGASEQTAQQVYQNMMQTASRYLAVPLSCLGTVPADEHLTRAASLGRTVIDAFPMAGASMAFRQLAGRLAVSDPRG
jgi:flagellar biosynthesis protein FlhG